MSRKNYCLIFCLRTNLKNGCHVFSNKDFLPSYSLTLIDALDMLVIMGNNTEFQRVAKLVLDKMDFDQDINVSVFETNIRGNHYVIMHCINKDQSDLR